MGVREFLRKELVVESVLLVLFSDALLLYGYLVYRLLESFIFSGNLLYLLGFAATQALLFLVFLFSPDKDELEDYQG